MLRSGLKSRQYLVNFKGLTGILNCLQDQANFQWSRAWQIALIFITEYITSICMGPNIVVCGIYCVEKVNTETWRCTCVSKLGVIAVRHRAITWINDEVLATRPSGTKFIEIWIYSHWSVEELFLDTTWIGDGIVTHVFLADNYLQLGYILVDIPAPIRIT